MCIRLAEWTTLGVGGMARELAVAYSAERLAELAAVGRVLGRGSNVLVSDDGYDGTIAEIGRASCRERVSAWV